MRRPPHHHGMTSSGSSRTRSSTGSSRSARTGRPHAVPLVGVWHEGAFAFCTGAQEQKQRNLDSNPQVAITTGSTGANGWDSGKDIVVEGTAVRVTGAEALMALADAWFAKYGEDWKFEVRAHEFVELSDSGGSTREAHGSTGSRPPRSSRSATHGQTTYRF
jgi:hypothetical protein